MAPAPSKIPKDPTLLDSDPEDDDFEIQSSDDSSSDSEDEREKKKPKLAAVPVAPALTKADVDDLWASFNEPDEPVASTSATKITEAPKKIIITVSYQFVGETVTQEKEVLENSDEAKNWLLLQEKERLLSKNAKGKSTTPVPTPKSQEPSAMDSLFGGEEELTSNPSAPVVAVPLVVEPVVKPKLGPPKRAKGGLAAMVANSKQPKLNTLEKSKLDWNKFVVKEDLSDDLTKARKDGYLDKQDFLQRTEDRKEADYDASKALRRGR